MINVIKLKENILNGYKVTKKDALSLLDSDLELLCKCANELRKHFLGNSFDICTIINGKSGLCSENCKYCAQSSHYKTSIQKYPLVDFNTLKKDALYNENKGILRYSVVTSGKSLSDEELSKVCKSYIKLRNISNISLCASHGLLSLNQFKKLKEAGVTRYHNNLETSRRNFKNICTTHSYDDKINAIKNAMKAGLEVCSGGIFGLGENMEDRIDMAFEILNLGIKSIPINILNPIKGTPYENNSILTIDEICRVIAIYRFIIPNAAIRLAGGRNLMSDKGKKAFLSGANAAISGDMLTTLGITIDEDMKLLKNIGFEVRKI